MQISPQGKTLKVFPPITKFSMSLKIDIPVWFQFTPSSRNIWFKWAANNIFATFLSTFIKRCFAGYENVLMHHWRPWNAGGRTPWPAFLLALLSYNWWGLLSGDEGIGLTVSWSGSSTESAQVWSQTEYYSAGFQQSRISGKSVFFTITILVTPDV